MSGADETFEEEVLVGGVLNPGRVVRVGNTVRRPRRPGFELVEALLLHLEAVGFTQSPRLLGIDDDGRQVFTFVPGTVNPTPSWQVDDRRNAAELGRIAAVVRSLHDATGTFVAPSGTTAQRPPPARGHVWCHGDVGYGNAVYAPDGSIAAMIDWEYAVEGDRVCDLAALLAIEIRGPRPDADGADAVRRAFAARSAAAAIADGYGMSSDERLRLPYVAAAVLDDYVDFWRPRGLDPGAIVRTQWRAEWFRDHAAELAD